MSAINFRAALKLTCVTGLFLAAVTGHTQELPWHLGSLGTTSAAPAAINTAKVQPGPYPVTVAVIDGGVLPNHPSLKGQLVPGYDMMSAPNNLKGGRSTDFSPDAREAKCGERVAPASVRTHGTEVASLIAGNGRDGVTGVNPKAKILPIRLFGSCQMNRRDLLDALAWSAGLPVAGAPMNPNPARVINLSFTGGKAICGADLQSVLNRIAEKNVFVVAAAGNTFGKKLAEPANCSGVISVGAIDAANNIENYSGLDARTVIYAPGGGNTVSGDSAWSVNKLKVATFDVSFWGDEHPASGFNGVGTSYAAPLVSGFVSLLLSHHADLKPADFLSNINKYSRPVNPTPKCPECTPRGLTVVSDLSI